MRPSTFQGIQNWWKCQQIYVTFDLLTCLKILLFIDFFAVALVYPLLSSYFKDANLSTKTNGYLSSAFSIAQLFGGTIIGYLSDYLSKKDILLLSFIGSGISYFIVGFTNNVYWLFVSRIVVGLFKQTMSTSTLIVTELAAKSDDSNRNDTTIDLTPSSTSEQLSSVASRSSGKRDFNRERELSHISAISSISFVIGPSVGGLLFKAHKCLPAFVASALFAVNLFICVRYMPPHEVLLSRYQSQLHPKAERFSQQLILSANKNRAISESGHGIVVKGSSPASLRRKSVRLRIKQSGDTFGSNSSLGDNMGGSKSTCDIRSVNLSPVCSESSSTIRNTIRNKKRKSKLSKYVNVAIPVLPSSTEVTNSKRPYLQSIHSLIAELTPIITKPLVAAFILRLLVTFVQAGTSSRHILNYYQQRYGIETYQLGFLSSYYTTVTVLCELILIGPMIPSSKNRDCSLMFLALAILVICNILESVSGDIKVLTMLIIIPAGVATTILSSVMRKLFLNSVPSGHTGKVLSIFNAVLTGLNIIAPIYGALVFNMYDQTDVVIYKGYITAIHYAFLLVICPILATWCINQKDGTEAYTSSETKKTN